MVGRGDRDNIIRQGIQALKDGINHALQFAQLVPIIPELGDRIHFIENENRVARGNEFKDASDVLGCFP